MSWFNEQIRQRTESDQQILEESFFRMARAVMDKWDVERLEDAREISGKAINAILRYYRQKAVELPETVKDPVQQLEMALRPTGIMIRDVELEENWHSDAYGPMLGCMKDTGATVALMPGLLFGYYYRDPETGQKIRITRKNEKLFSRSALCFYKPLPMKKIGIPDLLWYMKSSLSVNDVFLIVLATLAVTLVGLLEPALVNQLTGNVLNTRNMRLLAGMSIFLVTSAFSAQLVEKVKDLLMERINTKTSQAVQASVMMRILSLPVSFFRQYSSGELSNRATSVNTLCRTILNMILNTGLGSLVSLLYITQIFAFAPALVLPSILIILATVVVSILSAVVQVRVEREKMKLSAEESGMSYATLTGVQKIRLSGSEKRVFARWGRLYAKEARLTYNPPVFLKMNTVITNGISLVGTIILYYLAVGTNVGTSQYYAFTAAYGHVMGAFSSIATIAISVAGIRPVLEMAEPILKAEPEVTEEKQVIENLTGYIEMSHITFRYDEASPYVLSDLNLKIRSGEYVAIVGRTGCGKSTLVRLMLGFEQAERGAIYYDQHELSRIDPRSLRKHIGVVIQNGQLFQGDIFSNITISAPQLTLDDAWEAAEIAGIAQDIREMPMGMQTIISEGQGGVSGGQKQRLMIARAVAPKPKILIFDEATSALDNKTQKQVSDALDKLACTRIVIAHRLSTIRNCDRILVMDKGVIIEEGKYDELIARGGYFAELVERQRLDT